MKYVTHERINDNKEVVLSLEMVSSIANDWFYNSKVKNSRKFNYFHHLFLRNKYAKRIIENFYPG